VRGDGGYTARGWSDVGAGPVGRVSRGESSWFVGWVKEKVGAELFGLR
jgi:beta-lactamase class D